MDYLAHAVFEAYGKECKVSRSQSKKSASVNISRGDKKINIVEHFTSDFNTESVRVSGECGVKEFTREEYGTNAYLIAEQYAMEYI